MRMRDNALFGAGGPLVAASPESSGSASPPAYVTSQIRMYETRSTRL